MSRERVALWAPFVAALGVVFWLSSLSQVPVPPQIWDKLLHAVGYAGLGVLAMRAFHGGLVRPRPIPTLLAGLTVILWGISDEFHQSFVPGRDASARDVVADAVGFAIGAIATGLWTARRGSPAR